MTRLRSAALSLVAGALAAGCFTFGTSPAGEPLLRPAVQRLGGNSQVVGNAVVVSFGGVAVQMEPLTPEQLDDLYKQREGVVNPVKGLPGGETPPIAFRLDMRNQGRQPVQGDPAQFVLTDQDGIRRLPLTYQDFYQLVSELPDADQRLRSMQATTLTNFLTVPPGGRRDGFVFFPPLSPTSRLVVLELGSFYVGPREVPVLAEFEVSRKAAAAPKR